MKQLSILLAVSIFVANSMMAQKPPVKPPKQTVKDTFALRLLTSIDKLLALAIDEKITGKAIAGEFIGVSGGEHSQWHSVVQVPGSRLTTLSHASTSRSEGYTGWTWTATIPKTATGNQLGIPEKERAEKVLQSFGLQTGLYKGRSFAASVQDYDSNIYVHISFSKGLHNTETEVLDSLERLYKPLLSNRQTASDCSRRLGGAFATEGISEEARRGFYKRLVKQIAAKDLDAAFEMIMGCSSEADSKIMMEVLSPSDREEMRVKARKVVSDYADAQKAQRDKTDVVVARKKEIEKIQAPTDPCQKEIWELKLQPGNYISANGFTGQITSYSCDANTYTIAWFDSKSKRISLAKNVTVAETSAYSVAYNAPFMLCRSCNGEGSHQEYEWYQMNVASNYYAKSDKQKRIACGECGSRGCIVVR